MQHNNTPGNPASADAGTDSAAQAFVQRWRGVAASELSTSQSFVIQLCERLGVEASFKGKGPWKKGLPRILDTLEALGRARQAGGGWRG